MKSGAALLVIGLLLGAALLALLGPNSSDPLAPYRTADGGLHIPGGALTPEIQHLLFGGSDLQPYYNLTYYAPAPSPYATTEFVERTYLVPNPNVFTHPARQPETIAGGVAHLLARWFPPVDWGAQLHAAAGWFFGLFTWNARAAVNVDTTTVADVTAPANTCSTSQTTGATDNAVLVLLSERGTTTFLTVTYGSASLTLVASTGANGGTFVRTEIWGFVGSLPGGLQTMTATLSGGATARMTCATVLLQNVKGTGSFINGTSNSAATTNATVTLGATVALGNLAFAAAAIQNSGGGVQPTAVTGTGAAATDLYGVATVHCSGGGAANECAAGADILSSGTAITWTNPAATWVVSAVEVVAIPTCGTVGGGNCYRIGNNGTWSSTTNWSNTPGGASCGCAPLSTDFAFFNATPIGTTSLAAATTIAGIDMTGFTGTLDTSNASNWALTVNGNFTIQGTFLPRGSIVTVTGNVTVVGATTTVTMSTSAWTVNGTWTNNSTLGTWSAGTGTVTIKDAASGTLTFGNLGVNEFNNLTLDASVAGGLTYTMATNGLRIGGTLLIQNSTAGATAATILDTSASNLAVTTGALTVTTWGGFNTEGSTVTVNGNVSLPAATAYVANTTGSWTVTGTWTDSSTAASWSFGASMTFRAGGNRAMTFGAQTGNEFTSTVTFDSSVAGGVTYSMGTNPLDVGGLLTVQNTAGGATGGVVLDTSAANLAVNASGLTLSAWGALNSRSSTVTVGGSVNVSAGSAYVTNAGGAWLVSGSWTDRTTSTSWSFAAAVTFRAAVSQSMIFTGSNIAGNEFGGAVTFDTTAPGGVTYTLAAGAAGDSSLKIGGALALRNTAGSATAAAILDTSAANYSVTAASLTLGAPRGALRSEGSTITINGAVTVSDANSYLVLGNATWAVTGSWTNSSTDSVDWSAGTGTVTFRNGANATMTFANFGANELNNVVFDGSLAAGITYTMATNGLRMGGTLTVQNTATTPTGNVVLSTSASSLAIATGNVVLGSRGTLTANGSTITVNGSWTSTAANHVWNKGTSSVVFGASGTVTTSPGDSFNILTQGAGTTTLGSNVTVTGPTTVNGALDASGSNFTLTLQSTLAIGASGVLNLEASTASTSGNVTIAAGGAVRFTGAATWTINGSWTDSNASIPASWAAGTSTVRFVGTAATTLTFWTAAGNEFNNLVLDSSVAAGFTYTQVNPLRTAGTLTVQNTAGGASGPVLFDASATNYASTVGSLALGSLGAYRSRGATVTINGNVSIAASGYITSAATGTWTVAGSWTDGTTSASWSFLAPISFVSAANQTMTFKAAATEFGGTVTFDTTNAAGVTYTMATNGLTLSGLLAIRNSVASPSGNTILDTSAGNLGITTGSVTLGTNGTFMAEGSTISVGGNWTVTAANATFTAATSTVVFTAAATINMTQVFNNLTITAGTATLASSLTVSATLTVSGGILAKGTNPMALNAVVLSGGALTSTSGNVSVSGSVTIPSASSYIAFGSETWTVGGAWTNASMSAAWSAGTAAVLFNSATSRTLTLMAGSGSEFYNVTLNSGLNSATFTLAGNGLRVANLLTVQGVGGTTTLSTSASNLPVTAGTLTVAAGGSLLANGSTITLRSIDSSAGSFTAGTSTLVVNASGGTVNVPQIVNNLTVNGGVTTTFTGSLTFAGTLTLTSSTPTFNGDLTSAGAANVTFASATVSLAGSWDTSSAATFTASSSSVSFTGASKTITLGAGQSFAAVSMSGTLSQLTQVTATSLTLSGGSLTKGTNPLTVNGNLTLSGGALTSTSGAVIVTGNVDVSATASYIAFGAELWTVGGAWTNASTSAAWSAGTATVTFNSASARTMTFAGANLTVPEFANVIFDTTVAGGVTYTMSTRGLVLSGDLTVQNTAPSPTGSTVLTTSAANLPITSAGNLTAASHGALTANASTIAFRSFDTSAGTFNAGTSTLVAATTGGTIRASQALNDLTVNAGVTLSEASDLAVGGTLTVNGVFDTSSFNLTAATLSPLSGGLTAGAGGTKAFSGGVTVNAGGYFGFGGAAWTFAGTWTDNSTSASWSAGTGTVTFGSTTSATMTFAALPGNAPEFANVAFNGGASTVTFTMAGNALVWSGLLTVASGSGSTTLATSDLALAGGSLAIGNGGTLIANASSVAVADVAMTGGTSGTLTLTTGAWTVGGNWDTAGAGSILSAGTSTVTLSGASSTLAMASGQRFYNLMITGTVSLASAATVAAALTVGDAAVLTKTGQSLTFNGLQENGTGSIADGSVRVIDLSITNSDSTNLTTVSVFSLWTTDMEYTWTHSSTVGTSTLTFTIGGNSLGGRYNVTKDGAQFTTGLIDGSGQVVFTMLGSDPAVDVVITAPCGGTRYWVGGTGPWSATGHWSGASGGAGGCSAPGATTNVIFDANSGGGAATLDQNASVASVTTTGWTGTFALGAFTLAVSGSVAHASGTITIGASTGTGLTVAGNLMLSGSAVLDGSGAASLVSVAGNVAITSPTAYIRMGSGTWTFSGSWSNASTSASWAAGSGTVVFNSAASRTMTFANLASSEFYNLNFASTAGSGTVTFTLATNSLRWGGALAIQDSAGSTTSLATANLSLVGGSLSVGNAGILAANASAVSAADVSMTGGASGTILVTTGAWTVSGNWDTSGAGSAFTKGTGTLTLTGAGKTVKTRDASHGFANLTVSGTITQAGALDVSSALTITGTLTTAGNNIAGGANLTVSAGGSLSASTSALSLGSVTMNDAAADTISLTAGSLTVSGSWDTSGPSAQLLLGSSSVTFTGASATLTLGASQALPTVVVSGGLTLASQLTASSLTIASGGLTKATYPLTVTGDLTLSGGSLTSASGNVAVSGDVAITASSSYIGFGSEAWTVSGAWTNASTSPSWVAGTGTVTFNAGSSPTMTFAGSNLAGVEFNAVVFDAGASMVTFTLAASGLVAHTITVRGGLGSTTLDTSVSSLPLTADTLTVAAGGSLAANGSVIAIHSMDTSTGGFTAGSSLIVVNASGGTVRIPQVLHSLTVNAGIAVVFSSNIAWSGTLTLTAAIPTFADNLGSMGPATLTLDSAVVTIAGSWDTSTATAVTSASSSVTFTGVGQFLTLGSGQQFATLTVAGSIALGSDLTAAVLTVNPGALLNKTNQGITFNSLTAGGTLADGSVNVTGLTVSNGDSTALVTISVFTAWTVGSSYAWTHTSSETSQTITWTLGGNTAGFLYHVTKDGSSFKDGTVDRTGTIQFTMLGSDPSMQVTVAEPPPPPWWQAPYVLAMPPTALIVVIAMFAQRQRWRPTKAFLVDERGRLLREFTLDPKCKVTYAEAKQAGALDAVDKDVRVSRYHARAVRGDMLSLIMLAIGPANVQEVEFARGLLASVQDKFEDGIKQRAEEVRAAETGLDAVRQQVEEERGDLQTRARVFGDMVNAFTMARGKLDAESRSLRAQDVDLRSREREVEASRKTLDDQAREVEGLRASLDRDSQELAAQRQELEATSQDLEDRRSRLAPKEKKLAARESAVTETDARLTEKQANLEAAESKLTSDLQDYQAKAENVGKLEEELAEERKSLDDLSVQLDQREQALQTRLVEVESREKATVATSDRLKTTEEELASRERGLSERESDLSGREASLEQRTATLEEQETQLREKTAEIQTQESALTTRTQELADERRSLDDVTREAVEERKALDAKAAALAGQEADIANRTKDLNDLKENLGPRETELLGKESDLASREKALADERTAFQSQEELVEKKALEIQQGMETIKEKETALAQEKMILQDAKGAFESEHKELEGKIASFELDMERRKEDLAAQERALGESRMQLTTDREDFDAHRAEKSQWIASKEIELEAKEQTLADRVAEIRAQGEEHAKHLAELAAREETLEIESDKLDKARAELEGRKTELAAMARDLEAKNAKFRDEEARKGEELHVWQSTLESEQALLKEQRETFEKEMQDLRESWAGRMIRVEQREDEVKQREAKVQTDIEWVARNETEIGKREKVAAENLKAASELKSEGERLRAELEQRSLEIESRDRSLREEAANQSIELEKRTEALQAMEADLAGRKAQSERELATQIQKVKDREADLQARQQALDQREADLASREALIANREDALGKDEDRVARERVDLQASEKQLESKQLELGQARERFDAESTRARTEMDAVRQSLAAKEADLLSERERLERESTALQDKLGAKAKEMASREKAVAAREDELRAEEHDLEARIREIESRERQAETRVADLDAREKTLSQNLEELNARRASFDGNVQKFEAEAVARQGEWQDRQANLKTQEAQLAASAETRQAELNRRMEDLEQKEHSLNALATQLQIERTRLEAQAKSHAAKASEIDAASARSDKRAGELKTMEDDLLKARQAFESEKAGWAARRSEELKQLEATRDAAAEQTQQSERLIEDAQRRTYMAAEAEKAAKRQGEELAAAQAALERRRTEAEKAEKDLQVQMTQLRDASGKLAAKEMELASRAKELDGVQARLAEIERKGTQAADDLKARKATLDQEADRLASLAAQLDKREAEAASRRAAVEAKLADVTKREQVLTTELQRADNLMEDLNHKDAEIVTRERTFASKEETFAKRERDLAQRDTEVMEGMRTLERLKKEHEARAAQANEDHSVAAQTRKEAEALHAEAEKLKAQAEAMQAEVAKNMRFLQKKALDVLDREEKIRGREHKAEEQGQSLETRAQILDQKERALDAEKEEMTAQLEKAKQETEKLRTELADLEKSGKSAADMDDWKRDIENRVKIIQKKALELLDREEKLRKREEELDALAERLGVATKS